MEKSPSPCYTPNSAFSSTTKKTSFTSSSFLSSPIISQTSRVFNQCIHPCAYGHTASRHRCPGHHIWTWSELHCPAKFSHSRQAMGKSASHRAGLLLKNSKFHKNGRQQTSITVALHQIKLSLLTFTLLLFYQYLILHLGFFIKILYILEYFKAFTKTLLKCCFSASLRVAALVGPLRCYFKIKN